MREQSSVFTMFTVAELQPSHCSHQVTLTPLNHVHIVHHGHLVSGQWSPSPPKHVHIVHRGQLATGPHSPETSSPWYKDLQAVRQWLQCSSACSTSDLPSVSISCWADCCLNLNGGGIDSPVSTDRHTTASGARPHGYRPPWRAALAATETRVAVVVLSYEIRLWPKYSYQTVFAVPSYTQAGFSQFDVLCTE